MKDGYTPPTGPSEDSIDLLLGELRTFLADRIGPDEIIGEKVKSEITKRTAPSAYKNYETLESALRLLLSVVSDVSVRIVRYQYIERYRYFFPSEDREIFLSFIDHIYALRVAEIYTILERAEDSIRFAAYVSDNLGLGDSKAAKRFSKKYRAAFQGRLRERHKIVHAHERPSLLSRILSLPSRTMEKPEQRQLVQAALQQVIDAFAQLQEMMAAAKMDVWPEDRVQFQKKYLSAVDAESKEMWEIYVTHLRSAVGIDPSKPAPCDQEVPRIQS
ncbi:hypothetical protein SAMN05428969_2918 [Devosia sp. YR412]|uniref:hypothetical protein n=1 Tax=Devosia sp. YR412 TaxID=1881030 RepID=UPI0008B5BFEA|nr:hypothetical protein [Devosia sp. YR412]SEQ39835.1 hypothetical protein SAMN05428969_2918 [Devosia sp. YR412]